MTQVPPPGQPGPPPPPQPPAGAPQSQAIAAPAPTPGSAIASLILAILSWVFCLGILASIPAVICGHVAMSTIKKNPKLGGHGVALGGLIAGYINIGLALIMIPVYIAILIPAMAGASQRAYSLQSKANLNRIGKACMVYANNHNGNLPATFEQLSDYMPTPYDPNSGIVPDWLLVPNATDTSTPSYEFAYQPVGNDKDGKPHGPNIDKMRNPTQVILIQEKKAYFGNKRNVLYGDLRVMSETEP